MNDTLKTALILCAAAVAAYFVAQAVIPEKSVVERREAAIKEQRAMQISTSVERSAVADSDVDIPVVVIDHIPLGAIDTLHKSLSRITAKSAPLTIALTNYPVAVAPVATPAQNTTTAPIITTSLTAPPLPPVVAPPLSTPLSSPPVVSTPLPATPPPQATSLATTGVKIEQAAICAGIENRVPKGITDRFSKETQQVYYFTHVVGARDSSAAIIHRWYRDGKLIQTSVLQIRSSYWRTHSKRTMASPEEAVGAWRVDAVDQKSGKVLETKTFIVE